MFFSKIKLLSVPFLVWGIFNISTTQAQLSGDQDPPGIRWKTIQSSHVSIIFPPELEKDAQRVASTLDHLYPYMGKSLNPYKNLSLVLHSRQTLSNGYVAFFPWRSEWWNTPPQGGFLGWMDWYEALAIHEFRHVSQINHYNQGVNRLMYYWMGELGLAAMEGFSLPTWLIEGDAVGMETFLSDGGRGRLPQFDIELRRSVLYGHIPGYYQAILGSYRQWYPLSKDYVLGYYLCTYLRRHYGGQIIRTALNRTSSWPFLPHAFSLSLKSLTGKGCPGTYQAAMQEIAENFRHQTDSLSITPVQTWPLPHHSDWTYYLHPRYISPDSVVMLHYGLDDYNRFIWYQPSSGKITELFKPGQMDMNVPPSVNPNAMVWAETRDDLRWGNQTFSVIHWYDFKSRIKKQLTYQTRLFAPALSPDGNTVAAIEFDTSDRCFLCLITSRDGRIIKRFANPDNLMLRTPAWTPDGRSIVYTVTQRTRGTGLAIQSLQNDNPAMLIACSTQYISNPIVSEDYIYYTSSWSGLDNIYALRRWDGQIFQVTSRILGAYYPSLSPNGINLVFCDVDDQGYSPAVLKILPEKWIPLKQVVKRGSDYYQPCIDQEAGENVLAHIPDKTYRVKDYSTIRHLFNFHSWFITPMEETSGWSLMANSQNVLGTCQVFGGYEFNSNEKTQAYSAGFSYAGWYPIIDASASIGGRTSRFTDPSGVDHSYSWKEKRFLTGFHIPLNLSRSHYQTYVTIGMNCEYFFDSDDLEGVQHNLTSYLFFSRTYQGMKDIIPIKGQQFYGRFTDTPWGGDYQGRRLSLQTVFYLPGLFRHHGWRLDFGYEKQNPINYIFDSQMEFARGHNSRYYPELFRISLNYALPLVYPDLSLLHTLYSKRIHANLFSDYLRGEWGSRSKDYPSVGVELFSETYLFQLQIPFYMGIRYIYLTETRESVWELALYFK